MRSDEFLEDLRSQLLDAADRMEESAPAPAPASRSRRTGRRLAALAAAAALVVAVTVGALLATGGDHASAGLEVIDQGDHLEIRLTDVETRPDEIEAAARAAGVDVAVEEVPVGPGNVGRFIGSYADGTPPYLTIDENDPTSAFMGFSIPAEYPGQLRLLLGRAAQPGEEWRAASWATAKGGLLECQEVVDRPLREVLQLAVESEAEHVEVRLLDDGGRRLEPDEIDRRLDLPVQAALSWNPTMVAIEVADDPDSLPPLTKPHDGC